MGALNVVKRYYLHLAEDGQILCRFDAVINGSDIPESAQPVSRPIFEQTLARQPGVAYLTRAGKVEFRPVDLLVVDQRAARNERAWRDTEVEALEWLRERHRDEQDLGMDTTLTSEQFTGLLTYLQALRGWPQSPVFPDAAQRPVPPGWLATQSL